MGAPAVFDHAFDGADASISRGALVVTARKRGACVSWPDLGLSDSDGRHGWAPKRRAKGAFLRLHDARLAPDLHTGAGCSVVC